jgi:hypothetical protein
MLVKHPRPPSPANPENNRICKRETGFAGFSHFVGPKSRISGSQDSASDYVPFVLRAPSPWTPGVLVRASTRWFRHWKTVKYSIPVPYIDHVGKFTICRLGRWLTYPEVWFASVTATISDRLLALYLRRSKFRNPGVRTRLLIYKIATYYAFTHSSYVYDRILANMFPKRLNIAARILSYHSSNLGADFRFVHDQAQFIASWSLFRSKWIRDKPSEVDTLIKDNPIIKVGRKKHAFRTLNPYIRTLNWLRLNV